MVLKQLELVSFRNYPKAIFNFSSGTNLIIGPNAIGKTNLLEAIYLLAIGESFRAQRGDQMVSWEQPLALVEGKLDEVQLKIALVRENGRIKKQFFIDGIKKSRRQFLGSLLAVIFQPEEIRIISGSPTRRREFLDKSLSPLDWQYKQAILTYERALRRRNQVLLKIAESRANQEELFYWDQALAKNGELIRQKRESFLGSANRFFGQSSEFSHLSCQYHASPVTMALLKERLKQDLDRGMTTIGPHRDDFSVLSSQFKTKEKEMAFWGSRGQHRLATLALKLAQLAFIEEQKREKPILLLDDIFSELDKEGQKLVNSLLEKYQTLLTSTEELVVLGRKINLPL